MHLPKSTSKVVSGHNDQTRDRNMSVSRPSQSRNSSRGTSATPTSSVKRSNVTNVAAKPIRPEDSRTTYVNPGGHYPLVSNATSSYHYGLFNRGNGVPRPRIVPSPSEYDTRHTQYRMNHQSSFNQIGQNVVSSNNTIKPSVLAESTGTYMRHDSSYTPHAKPIFNTEKRLSKEISPRDGSIAYLHENRSRNDVDYQSSAILKSNISNSKVYTPEKVTETSIEHRLPSGGGSRLIVRDSYKSTESDLKNESNSRTMSNGRAPDLYHQRSFNSSNNASLSTNSTANYSTKKDSSSEDNGNSSYLKSLSSEEPRGLVGLKNIGNTCFMNSTLQCLFNLPEFTEYFTNGRYDKDLQSKNKGIAEQYASLIKKIRSHKGKPSNSGESTYNLKRSIERVCSTFSGYDQQDAQELLKAVLEGINEDCNRVHKKPAYKELKIDDKRSIQQNSEEWFNYNLARDNSIVTDYFCGQLMSKIICNTCKYESLAFDNFWDLSLSFTRGLSMLESCDLNRMFEHFLKEEQLEDLYTCEKCKTRRKSSKKFAIWKIPKILVIHLKRFHYGKFRREKIRHSVVLPVQGLNLKPFIEGSTDPSTKDAIYDLVGVVNHSGDLHGGHYTSECMNPYDKKWYNFNDDNVRGVNEEHIKRYQTSGGSSPYILFYCKRSLLK